jgi:hypothetical protein
VKVLEAKGDRPAPELLDVLVKGGVEDETASRAIASGARRGVFRINSRLQVSLPARTHYLTP